MKRRAECREEQGRGKKRKWKEEERRGEREREWGKEEEESRVTGASLSLRETEEVTVDENRRIVEGQYEDKDRK